MTETPVIVRGQGVAMGATLRYLLQQAHITQHKLSKRLGLHPSSVALWASGHRAVPTNRIAAIAAEFDMTALALLELNDTPSAVIMKVLEIVPMPTDEESRHERLQDAGLELAPGVTNLRHWHRLVCLQCGNESWHEFTNAQADARRLVGLGACPVCRGWLMLELDFGGRVETTVLLANVYTGDSLTGPVRRVA